VISVTTTDGVYVDGNTLDWARAEVALPDLAEAIQRPELPEVAP